MLVNIIKKQDGTQLPAIYVDIDGTFPKGRRLE